MSNNKTAPESAEHIYRENVKSYFDGDQLAADVWWQKYRAVEKDEIHPVQMFQRLANEIAKYGTEMFKDGIVGTGQLSEFGKSFYNHLMNAKSQGIDNLREALKKCVLAEIENFHNIILGGSMNSGIGLEDFSSLSNCLAIGQPEDSYAGIMWKDHELAACMKRRCGVGIDLSSIRPDGSTVHNQSRQSSGIGLFMERFSNTTREVAQNGRRGALMQTLSCLHPDVETFIKIKRDRTKVTGSNISLIMNDEFMDAVKMGEDIILRYPVDKPVPEHINPYLLKYGELFYDKVSGMYLKREDAERLYNEFVESNWIGAEPGLLFGSRLEKYSPDGVYDEYKFVTTNPCVSGNTLVLTDTGYYPIKDLVGYTVNVWNGESWSAVNPELTNTNQLMLRVILSNGAKIECTQYHKFHVIRKENSEEVVKVVEAKDLQIDDALVVEKYPVVEKGNVLSEDWVRAIKERIASKHPEIKNPDLGYYWNELDLGELHVIMNATYEVRSAFIKSYEESNQDGSYEQAEYIRLIYSTIGQYAETIEEENGEWFAASMIITEDATLYVDEIDEIGIEKEVFCFTEMKRHKGIFNGVLLGNCGEQPLPAYDCCRLLATVMSNFVDDPFTPNARFNFNEWGKTCYMSMFIANIIVEIELDYIRRIISKIENGDGSPEIKKFEKEVWEKIYETCESGRRCGCGFMGLADTLAKLNLPYAFSTNEKSAEIVEKIMETKMAAELDCSIDLAVLFGPFKGFDMIKEHSEANDFYRFIAEKFPEKSHKMQSYGRRNVNWSTVAPTGSGSILGQCTGGIEPLFKPYYKRRKKCASEAELAKATFTDVDGEKFIEYFVVHVPFKKYCEEAYGITPDGWEHVTERELEIMFQQSPYFGNIAEQVKPEDRVAMQALIQKYTTSSISSTINLPADTKPETISNIYKLAYESGLKGVTVYRDGSRGGVLVSSDKKNEGKSDFFEEVKAPKRPERLVSHLHKVRYKNDDWLVVIGMFKDKPYECFVCYVDDMPENIHYPIVGETIKVSSGHYDFVSDDIDISDIQECDPEQKVIGLMISTMMRHRVPLKFICKTISKADFNVTEFTSKLRHIIQSYITNGTESAEYCPDCWELEHVKVPMRYENGCCICPNGHSKC